LVVSVMSDLYMSRHVMRGSGLQAGLTNSSLEHTAGLEARGQGLGHQGLRQGVRVPQYEGHRKITRVDHTVDTVEGLLSFLRLDEHHP